MISCFIGFMHFKHQFYTNQFNFSHNDTRKKNNSQLTEKNTIGKYQKKKYSQKPENKYYSKIPEKKNIHRFQKINTVGKYQ